MEKLFERATRPFTKQKQRAKNLHKK